MRAGGPAGWHLEGLVADQRLHGHPLDAIRDLDDKKLSNSFHIWQLINVNLMYLS